MGTRADFYVGRGEQAEWLGSIAWDGYPDGIEAAVLKAKTESTYRRLVVRMIEGRDDGTKPDQGWPWPWNDSRTTDYAYAFDGRKVHASAFGHEWFDPLKEQPEDTPESAMFPDMSTRKNAVYSGKRSGLIVITGPK